jgi:hypothetical protein
MVVFRHSLHPLSRLIRHDLCARLVPLDRYGLADFAADQAFDARLVIGPKIRDFEQKLACGMSSNLIVNELKRRLEAVCQTFIVRSRDAPFRPRLAQSCCRRGKSDAGRSHLPTRAVADSLFAKPPLSLDKAAALP